MKWAKDRTGKFGQRPHYEPEELDGECERVVLDFLTGRYGKIEFPIKTDDLTILIDQKATIDSYADLSAEGEDVEGVTEFVSGKRPLVKIASSLSSPNKENRLRTTLTHEYGHVHFHQFMFLTEAKQPYLFPREEKSHSNKCKRDSMVNAAESDWMEWQAGYVCGALLMPIGALISAVQGFRAKNNLPFSNFVLNTDEGRELIDLVSAYFQTSRDAARVRLLKKGILSDRGSARPEDLF